MLETALNSRKQRNIAILYAPQYISPQMDEDFVVTHEPYSFGVLSTQTYTDTYIAACVIAKLTSRTTGSIADLSDCYSMSDR